MEFPGSLKCGIVFHQLINYQLLKMDSTPYSKLVDDVPITPRCMRIRGMEVSSMLIVHGRT
jgi:hypothetical protein